MANELNFPKVNTVVISGRLTRDVELRCTPSGTAVANLSIAFSRSWKKGEEWVEETSYLDVIAWTKLAERCAEKLHKGSPILVEGYLQTRTYTDKNNNNRKIVEIVSNKISFLEKAGFGGNVSESAPLPKPKFEQTTPNTTTDDVPF
ncbi:MAG: single-stranded DNA-binding protein [Candidatus Cloacimonetes bacterium]|jgi:single-strand DNA-binding protein|nr:single-stranded DNA-binding protein [Candidatus Cloacimonadota bacterium]MBT7470211.1 single-stranded DNA-binding protein [Candidatus Cloacimonadota bacterium]